MKPSTLVTARFSADGLDSLRGVLGPVATGGYGATGTVWDREDLVEHAREVRTLIVEFEEIDAGVLDDCPQLRLVACCRNEPAASVDLQAATDRDVLVLGTPGRNAVSVAEYTIGLMIALARHIPLAHHLATHPAAARYADGDSRRDASAQWSLAADAPFALLGGPELSGRTVGILGFGHIGRAIAKRCFAFDMVVVVHDPFVSSSDVVDCGATSAATVTDLVADCDFLVLAAKVTPQSKGVISAAVIASMRPTAYVINTARAALMDYGALEHALRSRSVAGAALDVFPREPIPQESTLIGLDNVVLSPHLAGASVDVPIHHSTQLVSDLRRLVNGELPIGALNPQLLTSNRWLGLGR